jgi:GxxExxY protein
LIVRPQFDEPPLYLDELAHHAIGAAIEVHRELGPGYIESVYEIALARELALRQLEFRTQVAIPVEYKGARIGEHKLDVLIAGELVVELKAVESFSTIHYAQLQSYLRAGAFRLGLLINFNVAVLRQGIRRVINSR